MKTVQCVTQKQFIDMVYAFVVAGLTFEAYADTLQINLTGGY